MYGTMECPRDGVATGKRPSRL